jgi:hypothetical protein
MKKLLLFLLLAPFLGNAQDVNSNINLNQTIGYAKTQGLTYLGDGVYKIKKTSIGFQGKKGLEKDITKQIEELASRQELTYEIINVESYMTGSLGPNVEISFKLKTKDGLTFVSKEEAKKDILRLKELLELGVINKEEFDSKASSLKKILLGN